MGENQDLSQKAAGRLSRVLYFVDLFKNSSLPADISEEEQVVLKRVSSWATSSLVGLLKSPPPHPHSKESEETYDDIIRSTDLSLQEFALYALLVRESLKMQIADFGSFESDVENNVLELLDPFMNAKIPESEGGSPTSASSVLLVLYVRLYVMLNMATLRLDPESLNESCVSSACAAWYSSRRS